MMRNAQFISIILLLFAAGYLSLSFADEIQVISHDAKDTGYLYLPGDANMYRETWPPMTIGSDVTFLVRYFSMLPAYPPCIIDGFWASGDANGDCRIMMNDVTRLVAYFRGIIDLKFCSNYPPAWRTRFDLPASSPPGWPNCE